ncbi:MAG: hypothetical protein AAF215_10595 [Cyanobacteria bacterium P01_A01_bin.123]
MPEVINRALPRAVEEAVPGAVQSHLDSQFGDEFKEIIRETEKTVSVAVTNTAESAEEAQNLANELKALVDELKTKSEPFTAANHGYSQCEWVEVGYDKSHESTEDWCAEGFFITQLDLSGGERPPGSWPVVGQALCCSP